MLERRIAVELVMKSLRNVIEQAGGATGDDITEDTVIVGAGAVLDSVEVVSLVVEVEQQLEMEHGVSVTLASDKAMSQRSSPFRTVGVLADHICTTIAEGAAA
jgi:acyl carrier protein